MNWDQVGQAGHGISTLLFIDYSLELRELEAKLKAAYMNKERMAQMAEKEAVKFDVMVS